MRAHVNLGNALLDRGDIDGAIGHFRQAVEIRPAFAEAHNNLGAALSRRGELDEAIVQYRRALEITPDFITAHVNLGNALAGAPGTPGRGQRDEALNHYQQALDLATAHHDRATADTIRAKIRLLEPAAPAGNRP